jgi:hypothetical protein
MKTLTSEESDRYLILRFLVDSLPGFSHTVAKHHILSRDHNRAELRKRLADGIIHPNQRRIFQMLLPVYLASIISLIYAFGSQLGSHAANIWLIAFFLACVEDLVLIQPAWIFIKFILFTLGTSSEVANLHKVLQTRTKTLLSRSTGSLMHIHALIEHFHPVLRAARASSKSPIARLLLSLTDYDLPYQHLTPKYRAEPAYEIINPWGKDIGLPLLRDKLYLMRDNMIRRLRYVCYWMYRYQTAIVKAGIITFISSLPDQLQTDIMVLSTICLINGSLIAWPFTTSIHPAITIAGILAPILILTSLHYFWKWLYSRNRREVELEYNRKLYVKKKLLIQRYRSNNHHPETATDQEVAEVTWKEMIDADRLIASIPNEQMKKRILKMNDIEDERMLEEGKSHNHLNLPSIETISAAINSSSNMTAKKSPNRDEKVSSMMSSPTRIRALSLQQNNHHNQASYQKQAIRRQRFYSIRSNDEAMSEISLSPFQKRFFQKQRVLPINPSLDLTSSSKEKSVPASPGILQEYGSIVYPEVEEIDEKQLPALSPATIHREQGFARWHVHPETVFIKPQQKRRSSVMKENYPSSIKKHPSNQATNTIADQPIAKGLDGGNGQQPHDHRPQIAYSADSNFPTWH